MQSFKDEANDLVSVYIISCNRPLYLKRAIMSVVNQTYKNIEILIVDDAEMAVKMTVRILKNMNLASDYMRTTSGSDAIQIVTASMGDPDAKIDAIFLDYVMPVVNGPTVAATIRQLGYTGVIIGVTALTEADAKDVFLGNGADVVTEKPLRPHAVEMALSTVVARMGSGKSDTPHK